MLSNKTYHFGLIIWLIMSTSPMYMPFKIIFSKNLITNFYNISHFPIINRNENGPLLRKHRTCNY